MGREASSVSMLDLYGVKLPPDKTTRIYSWKERKPGWIVRRGNRFYRIVERLGRWSYIAKPYHPERLI